MLSSSSRETVLSDRTEQRICLRFCFRLRKTATEVHEMLQKAFKDEELSRTQAFEWLALFKRGEMSVEDRPHSGRPSTSRTDENVEKIREQINEDRRYTSDEISEATGILLGGFEAIKRKCEKKTPRIVEIA